VSTATWPSLPYAGWRDTYETLHRWLQIAGKIRMVHSPWVNHQWHVTLYVTARGLSTLTIPYGTRSFQIEFDFIDHRVRIAASDGRCADISLKPQSVATFYSEIMERLRAMDIETRIHRRPNELGDDMPFDEDETHNAYDAQYANRFWRVLVQADRVFNAFRSGFQGKASPVHFFWGNCDLAVTRFSGRRAPEHPGGMPHMPDWLLREAYSHECASWGFWPGGESAPYPLFFAYAYPAPRGFGQAQVQPAAAHYSNELGEFILPYDAVRESASPDETLLQFMQSTYEAAADLGDWDRASLECQPTMYGRDGAPDGWRVRDRG
jgi:hypothetical protein